MTFLSTKTYGHDVGLSAVFRQFKAKSHCNKLHGYALAVALVFRCTKLDGRNWVVDFGALKPVKQYLEEMFDHKTVLAVDDPALPALTRLELQGVVDLTIVEAVGCEAFAAQIANFVDGWLQDSYLDSLQELGIEPPEGLRLVSVEVREHGANSAIYLVN